MKRQVTEKVETVIDEAESGNGSVQHEKKVSKYIFFGNPKLNRTNEEDELIEDDEIGYNRNTELSEMLQCEICKKNFYSKETYGTHIKTNYVFCTVCSHLFWNEKELKKHKVKCNICEVCGRDSHKVVCLSKNFESNNEKKRKET